MKHETKVIPTGGGWRVVLWPHLPTMFSEKYEEQSIDIAPDGTQFLRTGVSFCGECDEVREELEKILENWPSGVSANGKFDVSVGLAVRITGTDLEINLQNLSSE